MPTSPTTPSYNALVAKVRDWANRDAETLPDSIIKDAIRYGADNIYRELRLPPLEHTVTYTITSAQAGAEVLNIPEDLSEFISLRRLDSGSQFVSTSQNADQSIVYNQKADYRTFRDIYAQQYDYYRWTRRGNEILIHPPLSEGEVYELYYYRRLPAMNATYAVNPGNFDASLLVDLGATQPTTAAPVTIDGVEYTSGTGLFFPQYANITNWSVTATQVRGPVNYSFTFDRAFTQAEQDALVATAGTTPGTSDPVVAGSIRNGYPVILHEHNFDPTTNPTGAGRIFLAFVGRRSSGSTLPVFSADGMTVTWTAFPDGASQSRNTDWATGFTETVSNYFAFPIHADNRQGLLDLAATRTIESATDITYPTGLTANGFYLVRPADNFQTFNNDRLGNFVGPQTHSPVPGEDVAFATDPGSHRERFFFGMEPPHWLRDEQEKIIIWMALVHIFDYLGEMEMMQKYLQKAQAEMQQLNIEEGRRRVTGGNTQQNFDGFLI